MVKPEYSLQNFLTSSRCEPSGNGGNERIGQAIHLLMLGMLAVPLSPVPPACAQSIVSDGSLSTQVQRVDDINFVINGGDRAGNNLFHSFQEFSIPTGGSAAFNNASTVENIFSRVTGDRISQLDGLLGANGNANVFLINPNGVIFGANARFNIGGSLIVSTGDRFLFNEGTFAANPAISTAPLLLVSAPVGVQMGRVPGAIEIQGNATLQLSPGRSLLFVGSNLELNGGNILVPAGRIEFVSLMAGERVGFQPVLSPPGVSLGLVVPESVRRSNLILNNTQLTVSAPVGGAIALYAENLSLNQSVLTAGVVGVGSSSIHSGDIQINVANDIMLNQSQIVNVVSSNAIGQGGDIEINTRSLTILESLISTGVFGRGESGDVLVNATGDVQIDGIGLVPNTLHGITSSIRSGGAGNAGNIEITAANLRLNQHGGFSTATYGQGNAGNLNLTVGSLWVTTGGFLSAVTGGQGNGGNITIRARDAVVFDGESRYLFPSLVSTVVEPGAVGNAGNVTIETGRLQFSNGALLASATQGRGNSGDITINARDRISLFTRPDTEIVSYIGNAVEPGAIGEGGTIRITTRSLSLFNPTAITTRTTGQGNGGNLLIQAEDLSIQAGGTIFTSTFGPGTSGNLEVNVTNRLLLSGSNPAFVRRLAGGQVGRFGERYDGGGAVSGLYASGGTSATGQGGNLWVRAGTLVMEDGAQINVSNQGRGGAGNLAIATPLLALNHASLLADTRSGTGGSIDLRTTGLFLQSNSQISTNASGNASGGNIDIQTNYLAAINNSDITANARNSFGGRINIAADTVVGTRFRSQITPGSDITASSELGAAFNGTVQFSAPMTEFSQNFVTLPAEVLDPNQQIASACDAIQDSSFVVTGRGGLPDGPEQLRGGDRPWQDLRDLGRLQEPGARSQEPGDDRQEPGARSQEPGVRHPGEEETVLVEATAVRVGATGKVELVAGVGAIASTATCVVR